MMLVRYNQNYQKITMGFLSYLPELKDWEHLQMELNLYTHDDYHQLFLYKKQSDNFLGIVAVELQDKLVMVRYFSLNPAYRKESELFEILDELQAYYPQSKLMGTISLTPLIQSWLHRAKEEQ
ncbi:N-acetyltransferase [Lactobacillus sp. DCY120]|uniref:N-acetyltransferase n=1 Tax=Bombilactobacillus apium TaxID=2675299 RepID=A0A850R074_9LACO|nr:N-acetyltransferase [Bombilactobacillus apium]NVY95750.1 N-acetyltransferase [Bombilactobacillus apium]